MYSRYNQAMCKNPWLFKKVFTSKPEFIEYLLSSCINEKVKLIKFLTTPEEMEDDTDNSITLLASVANRKKFIKVMLSEDNLSIGMMNCEE